MFNGPQMLILIDEGSHKKKKKWLGTGDVLIKSVVVCTQLINNVMISEISNLRFIYEDFSLWRESKTAGEKQTFLS